MTSWSWVNEFTTPTAHSSDQVDRAVAEFAQHRSVIEQAKGVLMYVYRVTADAAFDLLIWRSQESNVRVRALAEQVLIDIQSSKYDSHNSRDVRTLPHGPRTRCRVGSRRSLKRPKSSPASAIQR